MWNLPFHPLINSWFVKTYGRPTAVQREGWPLIARGEHVLALAPTGSGKTLAGFLPALSRFAQGIYPLEELSVLYVSPLKALNEDIRRNLEEPLAGLGAWFERAGAVFPVVRVETRSGDTPPAERRRFARKPPSILALTPESLAILLLNPQGRRVLSHVKYLVIDEVHTALGSKRGSFLSCQIDRLALLAGEFQRVSLSATVRPPEAAADFTGGLKKNESGEYEKRPVRIVAPPWEKRISLRVEFPDTVYAKDRAGDRYGPRYTVLSDFILGRIRRIRSGGLGLGSTVPPAGDSGGLAVDGLGPGSSVPPAGGKGGRAVLVFTDSRRRAERISYLVNRGAAEAGDLGEAPLVFAHHGSLSREMRRAVEEGLASGKLPCVAATSSLELGIDIGSAEEVILAGSPGSSASALQRIGRSGHGVGQESRGYLLPFHGLDLILAAALAEAVGRGEIEETRALKNPLDVLSQIILALVVEQPREEGELYRLLGGFFAFQGLSRDAYDSCVRMLAGECGGQRRRELARRIYREEKNGLYQLSAAPGILPLLYTSGGVITSRGYYSMRLTGSGDSAAGPFKSGTRIGELDEEFVWERRLGDCFDFGGRSWRIVAIGAEAVEVVPLSKPSDFAPFWKADPVFRSSLLAEKTLELLDRYNREELPPPPSGFSLEAALALENFILSQKKFQEASPVCSGAKAVPLPGPDFLPIEILDDPVGRGDAYLVILHSFRGRGVNYPLGIVLVQEIEQFLSHESAAGLVEKRIRSYSDDNMIFITLPREAANSAPPEKLISSCLERLCAAKVREERLRGGLESSGIFGAAFREAAERSLLLPRAPFGKRIPLWVSRQRAKRLFDALADQRDFPISAEAWRCCLADNFNMEGFGTFFEDLGDGALGFAFFRSREASPFARDIIWQETNTLMYEYDERPDLRGRNAGKRGEGFLSDAVIAEALDDKRRRASLPLPALVVEDFCARLRRELPGWAPEDPLSLAEWVKERIVIPSEEWEKLISALPDGLREILAQDPSLEGRIRGLPYRAGGSGGELIIHRERLREWEEEGLAMLGPWLRYEGPVSLVRIAEVFGISLSEAESAVETLAEAGELVRQAAPENRAAGEGEYVCDRENMEFLLRLIRKKNRPQIRERPAGLLTPFLALRQGIAGRQKSRPWEILAGLSLPARLWESVVFPARVADYRGESLDGEIGQGRLVWYGAGKERCGFCDPRDLDIAGHEPGKAAGKGPFPALIFSEPSASPGVGAPKPLFFDKLRTFWEIKEATGLDTPSCTEELWEAAWEGLISADTFEPVRRGLMEGFSPRNEEALPDPAQLTSYPPLGYSRGRLPRALRDRWKAGSPVRGNWFSLAEDYAPPGPLEEEELLRERVRLLLARWGLLCRPLLERESPAFSWSRLLPSIRRMELAGELVAGRFFSGIDSLQFASPRIASELEEVEEAASEKRVYWMSAADPASPSGLRVEGQDPRLPPRLPLSTLAFLGAELAVLSLRSGRELKIFLPPENTDPAILEFIRAPRTRAVGPERKISVETINGVSAALSPYAAALKDLGFISDRGKLVLW